MHRGPTGTYSVTTHGGEEVRAFIPYNLPPDPSLQLNGTLLKALEAATLAVGCLNGISTLLPDKSLFLYHYVRKEAVLSSQIEGTQSSLTDLLQHERGEASGVPEDDVGEVSCYVAALEHGLKRLRVDNFPLSNRLIREVHAVLLSSGRGSNMTPGEFRKTQNWIGGSRPGNANFVPPPPEEVQNAMAALERYLHQTDDGLPELIRVGLAHVQLETIHPFFDGNGRLGRLLITFLLCEAGLLQDPLLYLSLYLKQHRSHYYELLNNVRYQGQWEEWLSFFLEGVRVVAEGAFTTATNLTHMFSAHRSSIAELGRPASSALRIHEAFMQLPLRTIPELARETGLTYPGAAAGVQRLEGLGIIAEVSGRWTARTFVYSNYLEILEEGTEPI
ncbi:MAG: Fic family protein [bacterium]|nr:Fic family protein [bacterium]